MIKIEFRLAQREDLNHVFTMFQEVISEMNRKSIDQWDSLYPDRNILEEDIRKKQLYIGLYESVVVSAYVLNQECDEQYVNGKWQYPNATYYVIHRLCVNPRFQNKGIGTLTMQHIENEVQQIGGDVIRLDVFALNPYAIKMYEKAGYLKTGVVHWRKGDFYLMEKRI